MKRSLALIRCLVVLVIWIGFAPQAGLAVSAAQSSSQAAADNFGYTWDDTLPFSWIDATNGGTDTGISNADDVFVGPLDLGFNFKFYENTYSQIFISTNGLLTFGSGNASFASQRMPRTVPPNNLIAPFWDDLAVGGNYNNGKVFYKQVLEGGEPTFVVEWYQVTRAGDKTNLLTFEAILKQSGNICLQYQEMDKNPADPNNAAVGIEDADGVNGLLYLYKTDINSIPGLVGAHRLCSIRPAPEARAKLLPVYQSRFAQSGRADFPVVLRNTGELGSDSYTLATTGSTWNVTFFQADGVSPLLDRNGDGRVEAGPVEQGSQITVTMHMQAPSMGSSGDYSRAQLTACSTRDTQKCASALLQSAVPAPFAQAFDNGQNSGMYLQLIGPTVQPVYHAVPDFTGSTMALAQGSDQGSYLYAWERNGFNGGINYSNIEYILMGLGGSVIRNLTRLTDNSASTMYVADHFPAVSALPEGRFGVVWVRNIINQLGELNSNVYLAVLGADGSSLSGALNITQNLAWRSETNMNAPTYSSPRIASTSDNRFVLTWLDGRTQNTTDLYYAVYNRDESVQKPLALLAPSITGTRYTTPALVGLAGNRALFAYSVNNQAGNQVTFGVLDSAGNPVKGAASITGSDGWNPAGVQLKDGRIVLAWTNLISKQIGFVTLSGNGYAVENGPALLDNPYDREVDYISITSDGGNRAILTWMDVEQSTHLFYALISSSGSVVTPPMIFNSGSSAGSVILTSSMGQGIAPMKLIWPIYLPFNTRR